MTVPTVASRAVLAAFVVFLSLVPSRAPGQNAISALAGYVHHAEGEVFLDNNRLEVEPADFLHVLEGQHLSTAAGQAEVMLTPEGFLRLGHDSEFEMISAGLASATVRLSSGSAVVDLVSVFDRDSVRLLVGETELRFLKPGVYRVDMLRECQPTVRVYAGRALVLTEEKERKVKAHNQAVLAGDELQIAAFDRTHRDALDEWSERRAAVIENALRGRGKRGSAEDVLGGLGSPRWQTARRQGIYFQ